MEAEWCDNYCVFNRPFVPPSGNEKASIMLIGEAPGKDEVREMEPFIGQTGKLLDRLLELASIDRSLLWITNTCCCVDLEREDKRPLPAEKEACKPRLLKEINDVSPRVIVALGGIAHSTFAPGQSVFSLRGKSRVYSSGDKCIPIIFTYHPSRALPFRNPEVAPIILEDLKYAKELSEEIGESEQLS